MINLMVEERGECKVREERGQVIHWAVGSKSKGEMGEGGREGGGPQIVDSLTQDKKKGG